MLSLFFVLLSVLFTVAALLPLLFSTHRRFLIAALVLDGGILVLSAALFAVSDGLVNGILTDPSLEADFLAWALDLWTLWGKCFCIPSVILTALLLLGALTRHPLRKTRATLAILGSVLLLILGGACSVFAATEVADLVTPIYLFTAGCASLPFLGQAVDAFFALRFYDQAAAQRKKSKKKNSKR